MAAEDDRQGTVEVLVGELQRTLDKQFETIDGLDAKAGQLFGVATLVTALIAIAQTSVFQNDVVAGLLPSWLTVGGYIIALVLYGATMFSLIRAYRIEAYYLPLRIDQDHIHARYLPLAKAEIQEQLLANYIEHSQTNWAIVEAKAGRVKWGLYFLGADIVFLIILIIVGRLIAGI